MTPTSPQRHILLNTEIFYPEIGGVFLRVPNEVDSLTSTITEAWDITVSKLATVDQNLSKECA